MDSRNGVASCKRDNRRLLGQVFELKPIKRGDKIPFQQLKHSLELLKQMSSQISNNYTTAPVSPNPYISRKLNNMDQAQVMKREREDWMRLYHKTLKGMVKDIKKMVEEANTMITKVEESVLTTSINNRITNTMDIT